MQEHAPGPQFLRRMLVTLDGNNNNNRKWASFLGLGGVYHFFKYGQGYVYEYEVYETRSKTRNSPLINPKLTFCRRRYTKSGKASAFTRCVLHKSRKETSTFHWKFTSRPTRPPLLTSIWPPARHPETGGGPRMGPSQTK